MDAHQIASRITTIHTEVTIKANQLIRLNKLQAVFQNYPEGKKIQAEIEQRQTEIDQLNQEEKELRAQLFKRPTPPKTEGV